MRKVLNYLANITKYQAQVEILALGNRYTKKVKGATFKHIKTGHLKNR